MLSQSFFPNFGQGPFPKIAGKSPDLCFALNVQRVQLCAEITASWMLKPFGEVGANFSLQLSLRSGFAKIKHKKSYRRKSM